MAEISPAEDAVEEDEPHDPWLRQIESGARDDCDGDPHRVRPVYLHVGEKSEDGLSSGVFSGFRLGKVGARPPFIQTDVLASAVSAHSPTAELLGLLCHSRTPARVANRSPNPSQHYDRPESDITERRPHLFYDPFRFPKSTWRSSAANMTPTTRLPEAIRPWIASIN